MNVEKRKQFIINTIYFLTWMLLIYFALTVASLYLLPFVIGIVVAYLVQKPSICFSKKIGIKKQTCAAVLSVAIFLLIIILLSLFCWFLYSQLSKLIEYLSSHSGQIERFLEKVYTKLEYILQKLNFNNSLNSFYDDAINTVTVNITSYLSNGITTLVKSAPSVLLSCVVTVVSTCYIAKDYDKLLKFVKGFINADYYKLIVDVKNIFAECFLKFSVGYFWLFLITFGELIIGFLLLSVRRFVLMALLVALLDLLPVIGTGTILIPWAIISFLQNKFAFGIGVLILYLLIAVIRNFIEPKIIGKQMEMNPLFTLIFIFIGFKLGGIIGMLVLPMFITVLFTYFKRKILQEN